MNSTQFRHILRPLGLLPVLIAISGCPPVEKPPSDTQEESDTDTDTDTETDADGDGFSVLAGDCDDEDPYRYPGATEICNEVDDDCDGAVDDDAVPVTWYYDADEDGAGDATNTFVSCEVPTGYVRTGEDCNDADASIHPGAPEVCGGVDEDCDTLVDAADPDLTGAPSWYEDGDGDGYGQSGSSIASCDGPIGYAASPGDCDDEDPATNPGAVETCADGDQDCDGLADDDDAADRVGWYVDGDGDGYGDETSEVLACDRPAGTTATGGDCDDVDTDVNPAAREVCSDGVDNDCDGSSGSCRASGDIDPTDEAIATFYGEDYLDGLGFTAAVADFDADGTDDLVLGCYYTGEVAFFPATSEGEFGLSDATVTIAAETSVVALAAVGDMTGDGVVDLAISDPEASYNSGVVYLLAGPITSSGDAEDGVAQYTGQSGGYSLGDAIEPAGDVDGDGLADLWVGRTGASFESLVYLAPGGTTGEYDLTDSPVILNGGTAAVGNDIYSGDLDGDGVEDLVVSSMSSHFGTSAYYFAGPFTGALTLADADGEVTDGAGPSLGGGDANGDGRSDLLLLTDGHVAYAMFSAPTGSVQVADADWSAALMDSGSYSVTDFLVGTDFDGDGWGEIMFREPGNTGGEDRLCGWYGPLSAGTSSCSAADFRYVRPGAQKYLGKMAVPVEDVTGDSLPELLIGEVGNDEEALYAGAAYLVSPARL